MKKVLITGGSGFFGEHLAERILKENNEIVIFDINTPSEKIKNYVKFISGDITNKQEIMNACKNIDLVYHSVALVPISRAGDLFHKVNVVGTRNLLEACLINRVKKVIHISSSSVYGIPREFPLKEDSELRPFGEYASTKYQAEEMCMEYIKKGISITIIRPRTIVGEGRLGIVGVMFDWMRRGKNIYLIGSGKNYYQFISPSDLADACVLAAKKNYNEVFNIGAEQYRTLREDLTALADYAGSGAKVVGFPSSVIKSGLWVLDVLKLSPFVYWHYMTIDKNYAFDVTKAKNMLGWKPEKSNFDCLKEAYDWYLKNYKNLKYGNTHKSVPKQKLLKIVRAFS
ncbi:NAD(P)-dependent oxidoreductase [Candidatus Woesearchaeota archaeon]|nr:NAD(P)-dependent oxidoreductase [Candidatus Woesearchaeota archaeon]